VSDAVLDVKGLHVSYATKVGDFQALHDIDLTLAAGEVLGIVGESGCGKSTLSSAILRLLPPNGRITGGSIRLGSRDLLTASEEELRSVRGSQIGMVFQDPLTSLNPTFRISTQMINAQRAHATDGETDARVLRRRAVEMLDRVGIADAARRIDDFPHQFSGGMRQRIMVGTVLLLRPQVLVCDEATSALDVTLQAQILQLIRDLCHERGTAVIVVSHDIGVVSEMCDRVMVLYAGRVVESGPVEDLLRRPEHPYTRKLLAAVPSHHRRTERLSTIAGQVPNLTALPPGCTFAPRCEAAQPVCSDGEPPLLQVGAHRLRCLTEVRDATARADVDPAATSSDDLPQQASARRSGEVLVEVAGLCTHFTQRRSLFHLLARRPPECVQAVAGVDLRLAHGEIVGLVGESGSGKTTLGKAMLNLAPITDGTVAFDGVGLAGLDADGWRRLRARMQMIFQEPHGSLSPRLRVNQLVTEPYRIARTPPSDRYSVQELLALVGLSEEQASKYPHELSGGQARRVGIARALALHPDFVIADEPTAGLDVSAAAGVLNLILELRRRLALTFLIITHDLNLVGYVADRIAVMQHGRIIEIGTPSQVMDSPREPYTQALLDAIPDPTGGRRRIEVSAS
jgi:peptide/nickel transport system ATP-binding protein